MPEPDQKNVKAWFDDVSDISADQINRSVKIISRETEKIWPDTNIGALIRRNATPTVTAATVVDHLMRAHALLMSPTGDPYGYLRKINAQLLEMAESSGFFERSLSIEAVSIKATKIAQAWTERDTNAKRGYKRDQAPITSSRQLNPPVSPAQMTDEQAANGREQCQRIIDMLAGKVAQ